MKCSTKKQNGRKPNTRKNKGRKTRKTMRGGEPEIKIQDEFVNKVGSNTLSGFLKLLPYMFGKLCKHKYDIGYDAYNTTKYHFGNYDNMIKSLVELTTGHNSRKIIFEGTILDSIIKFKNNSVKLPVSRNGKSCTNEYGCDRLFNGDTIYIEGLNEAYKVTMYDNDTIKYLPFM